MYPIVKGLLIGISWLPFPILYGLSNLLYIIAYYIIRYRRKVVADNLSRSFPELSDSERLQIEKEFYRHFCDVIVEIVKSITMTQEEMRKRVRLLNPEVIQQMEKEGKAVLLLASHYGNFEWMTIRMDIATPFQGYGIYKPLRNKVAERLILYMRSRWGAKYIPMQNAIRDTLRKLKSEMCLVGFISDQSPPKRKNLYFTTFLGQPTASHEGVSLLALRTHSPVYFADMRKEARGQYTLYIRRLDTQPYLPYTEESMHRFTDVYAQLLETAIRLAPPYWLWSHRRWKIRKE